MKSTLALLALAQGIAGHVIRQPDDACKATGKAVYVLTNDDANSVVALPIQADGTLGAGTVTPSGGKGLSSLSGMTNQSAGPDSLASQSALTVAGGVSFPLVYPNMIDSCLTINSTCSQ